MSERIIVIGETPERTDGYRVLAGRLDASGRKQVDSAGPLGLIFRGNSKQTRERMLQLQETAVRSTRWLPDILRVCCMLQSDAGEPVFEWFSIRVEVKVDADDCPFVELDEQRVEVVEDGSWLTCTAERRKSWAAEIRARARQAAKSLREAGSGIVRVSSNLTGMVQGSMSSSLSMAARRRIVEGAVVVTDEEVRDQLSGEVKSRKTRATVSWSDLARQRIIEHDEKSRRGRRKPPGPTATLWLERATEVDSGKLWPAALDLLQHVSTDAVVSLFACCIEACERGGWFAATPATVARHRGIDPGRMSTKQRQSFRDHLQLWTEVEIEISHLDAKPSGRRGMTGELYERLPLLVYDRTIGLRGAGEVPIYRLHGDLWQSMQAGKAWLFDRAALSLDMRKHDLHWRIYSRLTGRWSLSWSKQASLRKAGGLLRVKLVDLLDGSGVDWRAIRQERGEDALLRRVETALQDLVAWPGRPLLAEARLLRGAGKVETMEVEAKPTASLVEALWVPDRPERKPKRRRGRKPDPRAVQA